LCRKLHLFLGKSTKTAATRAALFDSNMHQIVFAADPTGGAYSAPPDPLAAFNGPTSKWRERTQRRGRGEKWREGGSTSFALERKKRNSALME